KNKMKNINVVVLLFFFFSFEIIAQDVPVNVPKLADLGVNGILLSDTSNVRVFCRLSDDSFDELIKSYFPPHINFVNKDSSELFVAWFHPGSDKFTFNEFIVSKLPNNFSENFIVLNKVTNFITYKEIYIGMSTDELKNILGNNFIKETDTENNISIKYELSIESSNENKFLESYGLPSYYGHYTFKENKLIKLGFGFAYP
ncbi:MAG: hypothetical protein Q8S01_14225, partial [Ignavibacteria bacterium]|nr:hypothetical protein [Ignavibacteria bacterium]